MRLKNYLFLVLFLVLALAMGCSSGSSNGGSSSGGGGTDNAVNVSGTWKGTVNSPQTGSDTTTLILSQSGNSVSGTLDGLAVTGTVSGNQLTLKLTPFIESGVTFTGGGSATVTGNSMSGTLSLTGTLGSNSTTINGTFTATRSNAKYSQDHTPMGGFVRAAVNAIGK